ncbi:hypothetical protein C8Q76DRAFT_369942 [Earliella scabrosa]|nr:hypothetical protein C8Q76DRAFT_369942 [Earliella scabrosa]
MDNRLYSSAPPTTYFKILDTESYFWVVGVALLIYEWVITFDREVHAFWKRKLTMASILFWVNRVLPLMVVVVNIHYPIPTVTRSVRIWTCSQSILANNVVNVAGLCGLTIPTVHPTTPAVHSLGYILRTEGIRPPSNRRRGLAGLCCLRTCRRAHYFQRGSYRIQQGRERCERMQSDL